MKKKNKLKTCTLLFYFILYLLLQKNKNKIKTCNFLFFNHEIIVKKNPSIENKSHPITAKHNGTTQELRTNTTTRFWNKISSYCNHIKS